MHQSKVVLFTNDQKGIDTRPAFKGKINTPDGVQYDLVLWKHKSSNGLDYFKGLLSDPTQDTKSQKVTDPALDPTPVPVPAVIAEYTAKYLPSSDPAHNAEIEAKLEALPDNDPVKDFYTTFIKKADPDGLQADFYKDLENLQKDQY